MKTNVADRELLELAAKACNAEYEVDADDYGIWLHSEIGGFSGAWDPINDDGDALRLAVKLRIDIEFDYEAVFAEGNYSELLDEDHCKATRRAIVRAAAEIGKESHEEASN